VGRQRNSLSSVDRYECPGGLGVKAGLGVTQQLLARVTWSAVRVSTVELSTNVPSRTDQGGIHRHDHAWNGVFADVFGRCSVARCGGRPAAAMNGRRGMAPAQPAGRRSFIAILLSLSSRPVDRCCPTPGHKNERPSRSAHHEAEQTRHRTTVTLQKPRTGGSFKSPTDNN
jgi:hypothetical protein